MREPNVGEVVINMTRIHELAVPIGEAIVGAAMPVLTRYAADSTISAEEFSLSAIYAHTQGIAALLASAKRSGANLEQLRWFVDDLLDGLGPLK